MLYIILYSFFSTNFKALALGLPQSVIGIARGHPLSPLLPQPRNPTWRLLPRLNVKLKSDPEQCDSQMLPCVLKAGGGWWVRAVNGGLAPTRKHPDFWWVVFAPELVTAAHGPHQRGIRRASFMAFSGADRVGLHNFHHLWKM